ncbi:MAG: cell wall-binding repeat-containing protein [Lagierella massiliensis]|nr:cell wall-binding repeat-containing protein [Lagierella massiliensis]
MKNKIIAVVALICLLTIPSTSLAESKKYLYRISGNSRYETAVMTSKVSYKKASNAVIVSGRKFPDGLTGGVLASVLNGPVLLVDKDTIPQSVKDELKRLQVKNIYVVGGESTISNASISQLNGYKIIRVKGYNRIKTATEVLKHIDSSGYSYNKRYLAFANSQKFPDSLSASGYLANTKIPLLLTNGKTLEQENIDVLNNRGIREVIIAGGESSVNPRILSNNNIVNKIEKTSFSGKSRYLTSLDIAKKGFSNAKSIVLVSGEDFPDALSASNIAKYVKGPILLTNSSSIDKNIVDYIKNSEINRIIVVGGKSRVPDKLLEVINRDQIRGPEEIGDPDEDPVG